MNFRFLWRAWSYRLAKETREIKCVLSFLKKGDTDVDIGANKGGYTYWMVKAVGEKGRLFAFEPQSGLTEYLKGVLPGKNVTIEKMGLSSEIGEAQLVIPGEGATYSPGATIEPGHSEKCYSYKVKIDTLDDYFENKKEARPVKFIKCDVEGHELEVFKGGIKILKEDHPVILFESEQRHLRNKSPSDIFKFLLDLGYRGQFIFNKKLHDLNEFDLNKHQVCGKKPYTNNFIFVHP
jgi:FkbM family methyltransferase